MTKQNSQIIQILHNVPLWSLKTHRKGETNVSVIRKVQYLKAERADSQQYQKNET